MATVTATLDLSRALYRVLPPISLASHDHRVARETTGPKGGDDSLWSVYHMWVLPADLRRYGTMYVAARTAADISQRGMPAMIRDIHVGIDRGSGRYLVTIVWWWRARPEKSTALTPGVDLSHPNIRLLGVEPSLDPTPTDSDTSLDS